MRVTGRTLSAVCFSLMVFSSSCLPNLDITAFEYQRKFGAPLDLGQCPQREVSKRLPNGTIKFEEEKCSIQQRGTVTHLQRKLNDSRNVLITSTNDIVAYLGICGGKAATYLGILYSGDCVAVEMASKLSFSEKYIVRAFVGYYRKSLDILEVTAMPNRVGMDLYLEDKYYLKNRSYGTLEIIFVQFRYRTAGQAKRAKQVTIESPVMSDYMTAMREIAGDPKAITVISLSTATEKNIKVERFDEWNRALRYVQILQLKIESTRDDIDNNVIKPHLNYKLFPFIQEKPDSTSFRLLDPMLWKETSMLEVQIRQSISVAKKTSRKCRKNKTQLCRRVRELRRHMVQAKTELHKGRSNWMDLSLEEKEKLTSDYTSRIKKYSTVTKTLAKDVRVMRRKEKKEKLNRKRKQKNMIPQPRWSRSRQMSRTRLSKRRRRLRL